MPPKGMESGSQEAKEYLAGSQYFKVIDFEIYTIQDGFLDTLRNNCDFD